MPRSDARIARTFKGREPFYQVDSHRREAMLDRANLLKLEALAQVNRTPDMPGQRRYKVAADAAKALGLDAQKTRVADRLISQVAADARDLFGIAKSAAEAGIPQPAIREIIASGLRIGEDMRRDNMQIAKAQKGPRADYFRTVAHHDIPFKGTPGKGEQVGGYPVGKHVKGGKPGLKGAPSDEGEKPAKPKGQPSGAGAQRGMEPKGKGGAGKDKPAGKKGAPPAKGKPAVQAKGAAGAAGEEKPQTERVPMPQGDRHPDAKLRKPGEAHPEVKERFAKIKKLAKQHHVTINGGVNDRHSHAHLDELEKRVGMKIAARFGVHPKELAGAGEMGAPGAAPPGASGVPDESAGPPGLEDVAKPPPGHAQATMDNAPSKVPPKAPGPTQPDQGEPDVHPGVDETSEHGKKMIGEEVSNVSDQLEQAGKRAASAHHKAMLKELQRDAADVKKQPTRSALAWLKQRVSSFMRLLGHPMVGAAAGAAIGGALGGPAGAVTGGLLGVQALRRSETANEEAQAFVDRRSGRLLIKASKPIVRDVIEKAEPPAPMPASAPQAKKAAVRIGVPRTPKEPSPEITKADVLGPLREALRPHHVVVAQQGDGFTLLGDLVKAGVPECFLDHEGAQSATIGYDAAIDLYHQLTIEA